MSTANPFSAPTATPGTAPTSLADTLFSFEGRVTRMTYWTVTLVNNAIIFTVFFGMALLQLPEEAMLLATLLLMIPMAWVGLAVQIKRWHDRGKSGWWCLINLIPYIGAIWSLVELGFLSGTPGANEYGPDPLGRPSVYDDF